MGRRFGLWSAALALAPGMDHAAAAAQRRRDERGAHARRADRLAIAAEISAGGRPRARGEATGWRDRRGLGASRRARGSTALFRPAAARRKQIPRMKSRGPGAQVVDARPHRRRPDRISRQKSATPEGGHRPQCGDPGGDRANPRRSGQDRRHGGHATGGRLATHPMRSGATATGDVELDRQCHPVDERR